MQKLEIKGGRKISGTITISGSKNATLPILAATILTNKKVIIKGCSEIPFYECIYSELTRRLSKVVYSLMYGEPCSRVPIFKNKKQ